MSDEKAQVHKLQAQHPLWDISYGVYFEPSFDKWSASPLGWKAAMPFTDAVVVIAPDYTELDEMLTRLEATP